MHCGARLRCSAVYSAKNFCQGPTPCASRSQTACAQRENRSCTGRRENVGALTQPWKFYAGRSHALPLSAVRKKSCRCLTPLGKQWKILQLQRKSLYMKNFRWKTNIGRNEKWTVD
ncbi:hypothetical protein GUJ93_ZPchr0015g6984 [Zizania palustris]|uniref:Uncharacterized protein n=1 Tax=Zizania palustris TaxID=103762 RepID=A0A8J5VVE7_ZIZPA|nr:hypothetical protein GUJ93_ZPchr0015g6984 [Zizania palustris]